MKITTHILICLALIFGLLACQPPAEKDKADTDADKVETATLQGTWKMTAWQEENSQEMTAPEHNAVKIYTKNRFFMMNYEQGTGKMGWALGGTYTTGENSFTETIAYYSGEDSTFVGTQVPFKLTLDDKSYHQSGVLPNGGEEGADFAIEEDYERLETSVANAKGQNPLIGVWKLEKSVFGEMTDEAKVPEEGMEGYKVYTPGHFYAVSYNTMTNKFVTGVLGTYRVEGDKFYETLITAQDSTMAGMEVVHDWSGDENSYMQKATVNWDGKDQLLEEHYTRIE